MSAETNPPRNRILDPMERISEVLFGLIMVLTFTGSISAAEAGRGDIRPILFAALGCNIAWGLVDAAMYLMARYSDRGRGIIAVRAVRAATEAAEGQRIIADSLPDEIASVLGSAELEIIRKRLNAAPEPPLRPHLIRDDWLGAVGVFLLVFISTFPVVIPFLFMRDARIAMRVSNGIAIVMLFLAGYFLGRHAGGRPWRMGVRMILVGLALVGITMALGG